MANVWNNITANAAANWQGGSVAPEANSMVMLPAGVENPFDMRSTVVNSNAGPLIMPVIDPYDNDILQNQVSYATGAMASANFYRSASSNPMCTPARSIELLYYGFADLESSITKMLGMADEAQSKGQSKLYSRILSDTALLKSMQNSFLSLMLGYLGPQGQISIKELRALLGGKQHKVGNPMEQRQTLSSLNATGNSASASIVEANTERMDETLGNDLNGENFGLATGGVGSLQDGTKVLLERVREYLEMARTDTTQPLTYIAFAMRLLQTAEAFMMITSIGQGVNPGAGSGFTSTVLGSQMGSLQAEAEQLNLQIQREQKQGLR